MGTMRGHDHLLFLLAGNASCRNRGSQAIVLSTVAILEREFGPSDFVSSSQSTDASFDTQVIRSPHIKHVAPLRGGRRLSPGWLCERIRRRILRRTGFPFEPYLARAAALVIRAGDNFTLDYGESLPRAMFAAAERGLKAGKPTVLYGATIGPFSKNPEFEKVALEKLRRMTLICARESLTRDYLAEHGIVENVCLTPDPAFVLEPLEVGVADGIRDVLEQGCLGLNLSPLLSRYIPDDISWSERATRCLHAIDSAVDMPIVLIPHVTVGSSDDHAFMAGILKAIPKTRNRVILVGPEPDAREMKWIISRTKAFVGARTHATVAALSTCVPTLVIGYSRKAIGINMDVFGHDKWVVRVEHLEPERLAAAVRELLAEGVSVRAQLGQRMPKYIASAWDGGTHVRAAIAGWRPDDLHEGRF